jgi:hypothetical protein
MLLTTSSSSSMVNMMARWSFSPLLVHADSAQHSTFGERNLGSSVPIKLMQNSYMCCMISLG